MIHALPQCPTLTNAISTQLYFLLSLTSFLSLNSCKLFKSLFRERGWSKHPCLKLKQRVHSMLRGKKKEKTSNQPSTHLGRISRANWSTWALEKGKMFLLAYIIVNGIFTHVYYVPDHIHPHYSLHFPSCLKAWYTTWMQFKDTLLLYCKTSQPWRKDTVSICLLSVAVTQHHDEKHHVEERVVWLTCPDHSPACREVGVGIWASAEAWPLEGLIFHWKDWKIC